MRWFANRWPALAPGRSADDRARRPRAGDAVSVPAVGACEVVLFSPEHEQSLASLPARSGPQGRRPLGRRAPRRSSPGRRSSTCSCSRTAAARWARRSTIRTARSTATRSCRPPRPARSRGATAARSAARSTRSCTPRNGSSPSGATGWRGCRSLSGYAYGLRFAPRRHLGSLPALDDTRRDDLAALLTDVLGRYDRFWPPPQPGYRFPYLLWFHQAPASGGDHWHVHAHVAPPLRAPGRAPLRRVGRARQRHALEPRAPRGRRASTARCLRPTRRFRAPGRVNLIGGQVDYHEGWVVSMAIDRDVQVTVSPRTDARVVARSADADGTVDVAADGSDDPRGDHAELGGAGRRRRARARRARARAGRSRSRHHVDRADRRRALVERGLRSRRRARARRRRPASSSRPSISRSRPNGRSTSRPACRAGPRTSSRRCSDAGSRAAHRLPHARHRAAPAPRLAPRARGSLGNTAHSGRQSVRGAPGREHRGRPAPRVARAARRRRSSRWPTSRAAVTR